MSEKKKLGISLLLLVIIVTTTIFFGRAETKDFSAYATCRKTAMRTKGYAVWEHTNTTQVLFMTHVSFSDGFNDLDCTAFGVGPFWITGFAFHTLVGCLNSNGMCPEDYFGVSP